MSSPKIFADFIPARLVIGHRWYILFYQTNPDTGKRERFRITRNLNRIPSIRERRKWARLYVQEINRKLPLGYPYQDKIAKQLYQHTTVMEVLEMAKVNKVKGNKLRKKKILEALKVAKEIKCRTDRQRTIDMVESIVRIFTTFIKKYKLEKLQVGNFQRTHALDFLDYALTVRRVGARTHNNYIERMRSLFTELVDREYIAKNPFSKLRKLKTKGKRRRAFSDYEKKIVAEYISQKDKWLTLGVLLQYHCFIRPIEMRRLRFYMFDLNEGLIRLSANETKNKENAIVTIPDVMLPYLHNFNFSQWPQQHLLFGQGLEPHATKCCGHNTLNYRHGQILKKLRKKGLLADLKSLTFYSWKDTGALALFKKKVNPLEIMRQLRHKDLTTTQLYCQSLYIVNQEIKNLDNSLIGNSLVPV